MCTLKLHHLFGILFTTLCLASISLQSEAAPKAKTPKTAAQPAKERLVLMPLRLSEEDQSRQAAMEVALLEGLQQKYEVFSGEQVAKKAREIFLKESKNTAHKECDETRCLEGIAEAFQAELLAIANVSPQKDGYFIAISIRNIFDNKVVFSKSLTCQYCNAYQVVEKLKELTGMTAPATQRASAAPAPLSSESLESPLVGNPNDPENALWTGVRGTNSVDDYETYLAQYPNGRYAALAHNLINKLKESEAEQAWQTANKAGEESDYQNYLSKYPQGKYAELAKIKYNKLKVEREDREASQKEREEQALWQKAESGKSAQVVQEYLDKYPNGNHATAARNKLAAINEAIANTTVKVTVDNGFMLFGTFANTYIKVDDVDIGTVGNGDSRTFDVHLGKHTLEVGMRQCKTEILINEGSTYHYHFEYLHSSPYCTLVVQNN